MTADERIALIKPKLDRAKKHFRDLESEVPPSTSTLLSKQRGFLVLSNWIKRVEECRIIRDKPRLPPFFSARRIVRLGGVNRNSDRENVGCELFLDVMFQVSVVNVHRSPTTGRLSVADSQEAAYQKRITRLLLVDRFSRRARVQLAIQADV